MPHEVSEASADTPNRTIAPKHSSNVSGLNFGTASGQRVEMHRKTSAHCAASILWDVESKSKYERKIGATGMRASTGISQALVVRTRSSFFVALDGMMTSARSCQCFVSNIGLSMLSGLVSRLAGK